MRVIASLSFIIVSALSLAGCQNSGGGQPAAAIGKDQIKGAWQLSAISPQDGKEYPIESAQSSNSSPEIIQLLITDSDFKTIISDERGLKYDFSSEYKLEGKRLTIEKTDSLKMSDYDVTTVTNDKLVLKNTQETVSQVYKRIEEKLLAVNKSSDLKQTVSIKYNIKDTNGQKLNGQLNGEAKFRSMDDGKSISCAYTKTNLNPDRFLAIQYFEFSHENGQITMSTEKNNSISFSITKTEFDFSRTEETLQREESGASNNSIITINDVANKRMIFGMDGSKCSYEITRRGKSLNIKGSCTGASTNSGKDPKSQVLLQAACELESNN